MEQYSNLNVHGKIKQKSTQGTASDDVVKYPTLTERVPATLPTPAAANEGKAIISNGSGYEFGEAGKVDDVQLDSTTVVSNKIASISTGTGLTSSSGTINHSNSVTAETTGKGSSTAIPIIKYDAQGHITEVTTATVYPPTTAGTSGQVWKSDGSGQGAWTALKTINSGSLVGSGDISLQTPLTAGTDYVAHNSTTASQVYATNGSKVDTPISYSTGATQGHIVQRGTGGQITVPSTPSADTDAASKAFVNSSVSTNTATFRGTYNAVSDLGNTQATVDAWVDPPTSTIETLVAGQIATKLSSLSITPTNNDYTFVSVDQTPVGDLGEDWYWRFKYNGSAWEYEYTLNNSSFTQAQWDAVNSGITADKVSKLDGIEAGAEVNVQADWNQTSTSADDYIKNKPTIGNANFKVQGQGTDASTFSANATSAVTLNIKQGGATTVTAGTNEITISSTDQSVTSSANHYSPSTASGQDKTASASGATEAWSIDVVKGVTLNTDGKGHVTGISVTSGKIPANPNTDAKTSSSNSTSKLFLVGATAQSTSGQTTYSNSKVYATNGALVADSYNGYTLAAACAKSVDTSIASGSSSANLPTSAAVASLVASSAVPITATDVTLADM